MGLLTLSEHVREGYSSHPRLFVCLSVCLFVCLFVCMSVSNFEVGCLLIVERGMNLN